jgi:hypothetical protein
VQAPELLADGQLTAVDRLTVGGQDARAVLELARGRGGQAAPLVRTAAVLAATLATTGDGPSRTMTFAPSFRISGSVARTPRLAATLTAAASAVAGSAVAGAGELTRAYGQARQRERPARR